MVTTTPTSLDIEKWRRKDFIEYNRNNLFSPYMGTQTKGESSIIHVVNELKAEGEHITIPFSLQLNGAGVTGATTLVGAEEDMASAGQRISIEWARHAVLLDKKQMRKSAVDQMSWVRPKLGNWQKNRIRDKIILDGLSGIGDVRYGAATGAQLNTWHDDNADRVLYGNNTANFVAGDHAGSLAAVAAADTANVAMLSKAKRIARNTTATQAIMPTRTEDSREYYVCFHGTRTFRDLKLDPVMTQANRDARPRDVGKNPLFQDGDLIYDGLIHREIPEIDSLLAADFAAVGAGGAPLMPIFLCGAQAVGFVQGQLPNYTTRKEDDYGFIKGRGIEVCDEIKKLQYRPDTGAAVDWGMTTVFAAAAPDS